MSNGLWGTFNLLKGSDNRRPKDTFDDVQEWLNSIARKTQHSYERRLYENNETTATQKQQIFLSRDETTTTTGFVGSDTVKSLTPVKMDGVSRLRGLPGNLNIDLGNNKDQGTNKKKKKIKKKAAAGGGGGAAGGAKGTKKSTASILESSFKAKLLEKEMQEEEKLYNQTYFEPLVECRLVFYHSFLYVFFIIIIILCMQEIIFYCLLLYDGYHVVNKTITTCLMEIK